jgi:quercetin dioxygenase-like cupin family protein
MKTKVRYPGRFASVFSSAVLCGALLVPGAVSATRSEGVSGEPIAFGSLPGVIRAKLKGSEGGFGEGADVAQIAMIKFTIAPGGFFGWHTHGGPVWVVVAAGELTLYESDDTTCTGHVHKPGSAFLDEGNHVHNARNEGVNPVVVYGTFMLPAGGAVRIDANDPGVCTF